MSDTTAAALSFSGLLKQTFAAWNKCFFHVLLLSMLGNLPYTFFQLFYFNGLTFWQFLTSIPFILSFSWSLVVGAFTLCFIVKSVFDVYQGKEIVWKDVMQFSKKNWVRILRIMVLISLLILVSLFCFIIPGIIVIINTFLIYPAAIQEKLTFSEGWARSKSLVYGYRLKIALCFLLYLLILPSNVLALVDAILGTNTKIAGDLLVIAVSPVWTIFMTVVYLELKAKKELAGTETLPLHPVEELI